MRRCGALVASSMSMARLSSCLRPSLASIRHHRFAPPMYFVSPWNTPKRFAGTTPPSREDDDAERDPWLRRGFSWPHGAGFRGTVSYLYSYAKEISARLWAGAKLLYHHTSQARQLRKRQRCAPLQVQTLSFSNLFTYPFVCTHAGRAVY